MVAIQPVEERRNAPVHDAVDVDRARAFLHRLAKGGEVILARRVERHRDVGIGDPLPGQLGAFVRQRLGMGFQREVDDVAHAQRRQPRHVLVLDPAGGGDLRVEPLPGADVFGIASHGPSVRPARARGWRCPS
jgi:hypothetical protein